MGINSTIQADLVTTCLYNFLPVILNFACHIKFKTHNYGKERFSH
jgi:hypothetical protein